uniref:Copper transport protein n=1 Tax=Schistocephalus solidus TaxID=70667 RepID=A0A0X3PLW7_SCHSO
MNHGSHGSMGGMTNTTGSPPMQHVMMMMTMYFNTDMPFYLLFREWEIDTPGKLAGAFFGCFILAMLYEGVKSFRERLLAGNFAAKCPHCHAEDLKRNNEHTSTASTSRGPDGPQHTEASVSEGHVTERCRRSGGVDLGYFTKIHLMQTGLHVLHLIISYLAMLIVMTYNVYMFLAIVLGALFGYFIFFRRRFVLFNEQDCCH